MQSTFPVVGEFGRIAVEFLRKGTNPKIYEGAASKYQLASCLSIAELAYTFEHLLPSQYRNAT